MDRSRVEQDQCSVEACCHLLVSRFFSCMCIYFHQSSKLSLLESGSFRRRIEQLFDDALLHVPHHGKLPSLQAWPKASAICGADSVQCSGQRLVVVGVSERPEESPLQSVSLKLTRHMFGLDR